jgi:hypothetical protein
MRRGDSVTYTDHCGQEHPAVVAAVVGAGPSGYKRLDVTTDGGDEADVPHAGDAVAGEGRWSFPCRAPAVDEAALEESELDLPSSAWIDTLEQDGNSLSHGADS